METRLSKKRKEAEQTTEASQEEQRESIPAATAKPAGSHEGEESRIGLPRAATNLELPAAEETTLPTDVEMGETRRGVRSSRKKLTPSKKRYKHLEIAPPLVLGGDGKKQGQTRKDAARSPAAERKRRSRQKSQVARPPQKKATVSPMERKRKSRARQTVEEKEAQRAENVVQKRKSRARQTAEEKEEETKKRRNDWAGRDPKVKEAHNKSKRDSREERTPEQVETENAKKKESMRGLRQARKSITMDQAGNFDTTKLWAVPGRDHLFNYFQDDPELSVLLWYANNGTWRDREPQMLTACLRLFNKLCSTIDDIGGDADAAKQKLDGLIVLCRESVEDKASLLRVVHEHIKEKDWKLINDWQQKERINDSELAALEWLVTRPRLELW